MDVSPSPRTRLESATARTLLALPPNVLRRVVGAAVRSPEGFVLDLQVQALLHAMRLLHEPEIHARGLTAARRNEVRGAFVLGPQRRADVHVSERTIPGPRGPIGLRVYAPPAPARGALVFFHGGGFVLGSLESHDPACNALAARSGVTVIAVDYRLAPEHRFPAALDDALAAYRWIVRNAAALDLDASRIAVGGDSAGGNLAAEVALRTRGEAHAPAFQLLIYPSLDMTRSQPSHAEFASGYMLTERTIDWFVAHTFGAPDEPRDPRASPLFEPDLRGAAPAFVATAGFDPWRDDGRAYAERLRAAGVRVATRCFESLIHGFLAMAGGIRAADSALHEIAFTLRDEVG